LARLETGTGTRQKIITFMPSIEQGRPGAGDAFPDSWHSKHGQTTRSSDGQFVVRVSGEDVVAVSQEILSTGPVADISIEEIPLEDIIAELFTHPG
jgi:ABC-2 type transport system ATP-binding protein